jgi:hypothetical protein
MTERGSIAQAWPYLPRAVSEIARRMIGCDAAQRDSTLIKPAAKTRSEQNLFVNRYNRISLLTQ